MRSSKSKCAPNCPISSMALRLPQHRTPSLLMVEIASCLLQSFDTRPAMRQPLWRSESTQKNGVHVCYRHKHPKLRTTQANSVPWILSFRWMQVRMHRSLKVPPLELQANH
eukprot:PhF_6_TR15905/c0_g1_i1/m.24525